MTGFETAKSAQHPVLRGFYKIWYLTIEGDTQFYQQLITVACICAVQNMKNIYGADLI